MAAILLTSLVSSRIHKVEHVLACAIIVSISLKDGDVVRQWTWPAPYYKLPVSVVVALNENLSFRCNSLTNASLYFSCGALSHKLSVAPLLENLGQGCDVEEVSKTPLVVVQSVHTLELLCLYTHWSSCVHTHIGALVFMHTLELLCSYTHWSSCVHAHIGALVFIHTLELLCSYTHWSSCVHTHIGALVFIHTLELLCSYTHWSSCVHAHIGALVFMHTLELLCSYTHWSSCVHTHIGALVFMHTLELLCSYTHWSSCVHAHIGALVFMHTLELLCSCTHWSSCVHTHTNSALWCVHTYLVELSYLTTRQQGYLLKTKGPFSSSTAHNMLPPEIPVKKGTRRKVSNHNQ